MTPALATPPQADDLTPIGEALSRVYGDLPTDPLPEALRLLVERLGRALADRR